MFCMDKQRGLCSTAPIAAHRSDRPGGTGISRRVSMPYRISNRVSGATIGAFDGDSESSAIDAMARDAGYADAADMHGVNGESLDNLDVVKIGSGCEADGSYYVTDDNDCQTTSWAVSASAALREHRESYDDATDDRPDGEDDDQPAYVTARCGDESLSFWLPAGC